ncbi:hypothetical protein BK147_08620 [Paenibacillus sp. FSL R7-0337]|uniref:hypothetical protein n=1 Tax=Paenibacillus sp. FSL H7-0350 TaxID=2975345 RepID=UPI0003E2AC52|nr:hypothetical protein C162_07244 [Paenibacillus sp. FSL R7-269]OMF98880.1 hypothetical protein BK147_08620 [Paenibacillus sp. FSL R7-0337]
MLLSVVGCSNNQNIRGEQTDEQTAAGYIEALGYTIVASEGETSRYTLEPQRLESLEDMQFWAVQEEEASTYFGKEITTYPFIVKNHPLEQQYPPDQYKISVNVMIADHEVIGGSSAPLSTTKNLVVAGGEYSIEGKTLEEIKGLEYSQWLKHWKETYGPEVSVSGYIPINELKSLSEKATSLHWNDFDKYVFEDIGSGVYIRKYEIEGEGQLLVRGKSLEKPPEQITMIDADGKEREFNPESLSEQLK